MQDPSCQSYAHALLYFKGYHAIQLYRFAHELWEQDRKAMSLSLQSRLSEVLAVDIHPAAKIHKGVLMDHGTGVVIGETAVIGNGVSIMQARIVSLLTTSPHCHRESASAVLWAPHEVCVCRM